MEPTRIPSGVRRAAALAAVAAAAALAFPVAANAAVTGTVTGDTATLTGDAANDNIVISVSGANLRHNLSGFNSNIDFDSAQAGDQTLTTAGTLTIDGGAGDDIIVGGPNLDTLLGGDGNDRLTGGPNPAAGPKEQISGGNGNDVMIWNNGDGSDINDGEAGADTTLVNNGTADDQMAVRPLGGGAHQFERTNNPFTVDMGATTERLSIVSLAGNDNLATAAGVAVPIEVDAGPGNDTITGGDGADALNGGDGDDTLNGGEGTDVIQGGPDLDTLNGQGGGDRLIGGPNPAGTTEAHNGGAGDDTLVWNNGDGTDDMNGEDGLDRVEDNLGAANDVSQVKVDGGKVRFDRINAPFGLNIASSEVLELNTFGGNDTLDVQPGVGNRIAIVADAGSGDDRLNGGDEADHFFGGLGNDTLEPGAGSDAVDGQAGDDTLKVRDGAGDHARGGDGTDSAVADAADVLADVEKADVARSAATIVRSKKITSKLRRGVYTARVQLECPASETNGCKGTLTLQTRKAVRLGGVKINAILASKSYSLKAGERKTVSVKLPKGVRKLSKKGRLSLRAITSSKDSAGNPLTSASNLSVRLVK